MCSARILCLKLWKEASVDGVQSLQLPLRRALSDRIGAVGEEEKIQAALDPACMKWASLPSLHFCGW